MCQNVRKLFSCFRVPFIRDGICLTGAVRSAQLKNNVNLLEGYSILDVGCGGGILSEVNNLKRYFVIK